MMNRRGFLKFVSLLTGSAAAGGLGVLGHLSAPKSLVTMAQKSVGAMPLYSFAADTNTGIYFDGKRERMVVNGFHVDEGI